MNNIDFLSRLPKFYVYKQDRYHSKIGITLSILSLISMLSLIIYFVYATFSRSNIFIRYSTSTKYSKVINLTDTPFLFTALDVSGNYFPNPETIFSLYLQYSTIVPGNVTLGIETKRFAETKLVERCKRSDYIGTLFESYPDIEKYFCTKPGARNLTIYNKFGDLVNGYGFVNLFINKCSNSSLYYNGKNCADSTTINSALSRGFFAFVYVDNIINHDNVTNPYESYIATEVFDMSTTIFQRIYFTLKNVYYETADGFVFDTSNTVQFTQQDYIRLYADNRPSGIYPETYSSIFIQASGKADVYNRSYVKLQSLLANIGGVVNGIITLANILVYILTTKLNSVNLIEHLFKLEEGREFHNHSSIEVNRRLSNRNNSSVRKLNNNYNNPKEISSINDVGKHQAGNPIGNVSSHLNNVNNYVDNNASFTVNNITTNNIKPVFKFNVLEYICPFNAGKNSALTMLYRYEKVIRNELSIDNIINKSGEVNKLVELLTLEQKVEFKKLNALNLTLLKVAGS
jgi:hypothetical protein